MVAWLRTYSQRWFSSELMCIYTRVSDRGSRADLARVIKACRLPVVPMWPRTEPVAECNTREHDLVMSSSMLSLFPALAVRVSPPPLLYVMRSPGEWSSCRHGADDWAERQGMVQSPVTERFPWRRGLEGTRRVGPNLDCSR